MKEFNELYDKIKNGSEVDEKDLKKQFLKLYNEKKDIDDSIRYAAVLQKNILGKQRHFDKIFPQSFIFFRPQHHVSGDFYWTTKKDNYTYIACGDCTGHGVPGSTLAMLAHSLLTYSVLDTKEIVSVSDVLKMLDERIIEAFRESHDSDSDNDWIDLAVCRYDNDTGELVFGGANQKIFLVRNKKLTKIKGAPYPIGGWQIEDVRTYPTRSFKMKKGDVLYIGSDGFQDQFGGERDKKYTSRRLINLLKGIHHLPMTEQVHIIESEFDGWKRGYDQIDDVTVLGIRF
ncbi:MAG: putative serine phosphatase [uncultured marine phage]|uniref:Putative serine phosphatase n=1 Tax=uncultured marine phage TaxID=707152 RepID=A0A8D9CDR3_9VIRU|nr:MAG: putative serine phosphatase [uncultured marine phage]